MLKNKNHEVVRAKDGEDAIKKFESKNDFSLILIDIKLPKLNGFETTKKIRKLEEKVHKNRRIPIIALTACAMKGDREKCLDAGCNDYLSKPINLKSFYEMVSRSL